MDNEWREIGGLLDGIIDYRGKTPPKSDSGIVLHFCSKHKKR